MGELIESLLTFSRFARQPIEKRQVAVSELVERVVAQLRSDPRNAPSRSCVGDLPACSGDPSLLEQVFTNLLANAFKFSRGSRRCAGGDRRRARAATRVEYVVRDNGVGFDMKYASKLFGVFQRLHSRGEFEGTGIGLSIVQRIVQRHGGRVWAAERARLGRGLSLHPAGLEKRPESCFILPDTRLCGSDLHDGPVADRRKRLGVETDMSAGPGARRGRHGHLGALAAPSPGSGPGRAQSAQQRR